MEQITSVFGINEELIIIQMVNFGLLLFVLHRYLYKPVLAMVDTRRAKIERGVRNAEQAEVELGQAEAEKARILREATLKGDELIDLAKKHALEEEHVLLKDAHRKVAHLLSEAERRALREREEMIKDSEREVARTAILAAEKILRNA